MMATPLPAAYIEISKRRCLLTLYLRKTNKREKFERFKTYTVSIGVPAHPTPSGVFSVTVKAKNPAWKMPNSSWVPVEKRGDIVPGGHADNPLIARWIQVYHGIGIHGTRDLAHLGQPASHGCIRMAPKDVIEVYHYTPKYSIVKIK